MGSSFGAALSVGFYLVLQLFVLFAVLATASSRKFAPYQYIKWSQQPQQTFRINNDKVFASFPGEHIKIDQDRAISSIRDPENSDSDYSDVQEGEDSPAI